MKFIRWLLGTIPVLLVIAALVGMFYATQNPDKVKEVESWINSNIGPQEEYIETAPTRDLSPSYELPLNTHSLGRGFYADPYIPVLTAFKSIEEDLYIPLRERNDVSYTGNMFFCDENGVLRWQEEPEIVTDQVNGYIRVPHKNFQNIEAGEYWMGLLVGPQDNPDWSYYRIYYIVIQDECEYRSSAPGVANRGRFVDTSIVYRTGDPGVTYNLYNLGDNYVTKVWYITRAVASDKPAMQRLKEGEFSVSEDGSSVTILPAFLDKQRAPLDMHFSFGLADGTTVSTTDMFTYFDVSLLLLDDESDIPYMTGPYSYSLSSGEDYVFTMHEGKTGILYKDYETALRFLGEEGVWLDEPYLALDRDNIGENDAYVIPAELFQKAYDMGARQAWFNAIFDFGKGSFTHWTIIVDLQP